MRAVERVSEAGWVPPWTRYQHIARYWWATGFANGCEIADAACGTGYGTKVLLEAGARRFIGFDLSKEAIDQARSGCTDERVRFAVADVTHLPLRDASIDLFISFETIEHVTDDRGYVAETRRVLRPGGKLLCSTPNRALTNPGTTILDRPYNPFHVREYTSAELESLLRERFGSIELYGQTRYRLLPLRLIRAIGAMCPSLAVRLVQARKLVGMPLERLARHTPTPLRPAEAEPEIVIAVCTP